MYTRIFVYSYILTIVGIWSCISFSLSLSLSFPLSPPPFFSFAHSPSLSPGHQLSDLPFSLYLTLTLILSLSRVRVHSRFLSRASAHTHMLSLFLFTSFFLTLTHRLSLVFFSASLLLSFSRALSDTIARAHLFTRTENFPGIYTSAIVSHFW